MCGGRRQGSVAENQGPVWRLREFQQSLSSIHLFHIHIMFVMFNVIDHMLLRVLRCHCGSKVTQSGG